MSAVFVESGLDQGAIWHFGEPNQEQRALAAGRAWADLSQREKNGEKIDSRDIKKHRNDVFQLAATLPGEPGPELPSTIQDDLRAFLEAFREDSNDWNGIRDSLKDTMARGISIAGLRSAIQRYYRL